MNNKDISKLRINYDRFELHEENVPQNPFQLFQTWFDEALHGEIREPNAMVLSTVSQGKPHSRVVLLKGIEDNAFEFYSNYHSHKGQELAENPYAALTFFYDTLQRQIRIEGKVSRVSAEKSDAYFASRPRGSQIGAWVSLQSESISGRAFLEERQVQLEAQFEGLESIPRPAHWGGYAVHPERIEFWQGRPSRLHDRLVYTLQTDGSWKLERLCP